MLLSIISQKRYFMIVILAFFVYVFIYLIAIGHLFFSTSTPLQSPINVKIFPNWQELIFKARSPFLFEAIGVIQTGSNIKIFLSIPNLLIAMLLGILVGINIALSYLNFRRIGLSGVGGLLRLLGTIPAIISGAACCVPTLVLVLGLQLTATLATAWSFFVPLAIALLLVSIAWSLHRIQTNRL